MSPPMSQTDNGTLPTNSNVKSDNQNDVVSPKTPPPPSSCSRPSSASTPLRATNNYSNTNTPIMSAKRPRRRVSGGQNLNSANSNQKLTPPPLSTFSNNNDGTRTPMRASRGGICGGGAASADDASNDDSYLLNLSPMHAVKPVPRDSHHVPTSSSYRGHLSIPAVGPSESQESELSEVPSEYHTSVGNDDGESPSNQSSTSWVGRKVDALFSPVLSYLHAAASTSRSSHSESMSTNNSGNSSTFLSPSKSKEEASKSSSRQDSIRHSKSDDSNDNAAAVSNAIRDALREAALEVQDDEVAYGPMKNASSSDSFDNIPGMSITESSGDGNAGSEDGKSKDVTDADGDVAMTDCYPEGVEKDTSFDNLSEVRLNESQEFAVDKNQSVEHNDVPAPTTQDSEEDEEEEEFNPYLFIKSLPPYKYAIPPGWGSRPKTLPPLDPSADPPVPPICLVLDLDETLVHCTVEPIPDADMVFPVEFNGMEYQVHVRCRPFLSQFLEAVHTRFEVVVFTASQQVYADKLLDKIDPEGKFIRHRMFRDSCLPVEGNFLKDLTVLGRDLRKTVLVDNSPHAFGYQVDNGIPIESWFDDPSDTELLKLELFLRTLHDVDDVRELVRAKFQTFRLVLDA